MNQFIPLLELYFFLTIAIVGGKRVEREAEDN